MLGDGLGEYGHAIADGGLAELVDSFDGAPFVEELTAGRVHFLDLAVPCLLYTSPSPRDS